MNIAVTYFSKTGNTKKVADAIANAAGVKAIPASEYQAAPADLLFIGGAIYGGAIDPAFAAFLDTLDAQAIKSTALFCTYMSSPKARDQMKAVLAAKGIPVAATFTCKGKFLLFNRKHPSEADLGEAREFAAKLVAQAV
jgi:flavodoxin